MLDSEKKQFAELFRGVCATYGREVSKDAMRMAWEILVPFDITQVQHAYYTHVSTSKYMPAPAEISDIIKSINPAMIRPGADEAWARMPRSEDDSVVWTEEMAYAWNVANGLVNPYLVERPDWTAARMAFKDAYTRAVDTAKAQGRVVKWTVARGQRKDNLEDVLTEALRLGYITQEQARPHLLELENLRADNQRLLLEGTKGPSDKERFMQEMKPIKALLNRSEPPPNMDQVREECESKDRERRAAA